MKKESESAKLRAAAQMRIDQYFVSALDEKGDCLSSLVRSNIERIINGSHLTFRYMLFTGLLVAVTDRKFHPRCLQDNAQVEGAFDARSLCQKVVVPFEKKMLNGRLGASNEPYANKPARYPMIEKTNAVRKGTDEALLFALYDVLEFIHGAEDDVRRAAFRFMLSLVCRLPPNKASVTALPPIASSITDVEAFFAFLGAHTKGIASVSVLAAFFHMFYPVGTKIKVHPSTESGASSNEVGDIDLEFADGRTYAVEVKDKSYSDVDVNHACEKALHSGVSKLVFASGMNAGRSRVSWGALVDYWAEKGIELSHLSIEDSLGVAMAVTDRSGRYKMASCIGQVLDEMNASRDVKDLFARTFKGKGA